MISLFTSSQPCRVMRSPRFIHPMPIFIKHALPSGLEQLYPVLVSYGNNPDGVMLVSYANGAVVLISESSFIQLELAQSDLSCLTATPLPGEVIRRDMLH